MEGKKIITLIWVCILTFGSIYGKHAHDLLLKNERVSLPENANSFAKDFVPQAEHTWDGRYYLIVQFDHLPNQAEQDRLKSYDIRLLGYLPKHAYIVSFPMGFDLNLLLQLGARSFMEPDHRVKLSRDLYQLDIPEHARDGELVKLTVKPYKDVNPLIARQWLAQRYQMDEHNPNPRLIRVVGTPTELLGLLDIPFAQYIQITPPPPKKDDFEGRSLHRSNAINVDYGAGRHYDGSGVVIGLADDGPVGPHIDFTGRMTQLTTTGSGSHGDMTAGILCGAGNRDPWIQGHASGAYMYYWRISGYPQVIDAVNNYNNYGVIITSTSFSQGTGGVYDSSTEFIDEQIHDNPQLIHVFSAGNAGTSNHGYGAGAGWGNITGGRKAGKHVVACGNLNDSDVLENSSSRGPADDGRIKPDICANGAGQLSTAANNTTQTGGGTSAAAPSVAGCITQLYQAYKELNGGNEPESPLIKACVLNTAEDLGRPGPDFEHGWGRINALRAVRVLEDNTYTSDSIVQGQTKTHTFTVPSGTQEVRAMVYWLDVEGNPSAQFSLVNDLNMTLTNPSNQTFDPWILDYTPVASLLDNNAVRGRDSVNNMEQVTLTNPAAGTYTVTVNGYAVPQGPQKYYVVWETRTAGVELTYPIGGEGFDPSDNQKIRWDAHGPVGNFTLEYSTNNGTTWNTISSNINSSLRQYSWNVPNIVTGQALMRISNNGFSSQSHEPFTIIDRTTNITVDFACPDSIGLSWNSVSGAVGYEVTALGAEYMDSVTTVTGNSAVIYGFNPANTNWFSVAALAPNNGRGRRANAISHQGVTNCSIGIDMSAGTITSPAASTSSLCSASGLTPVTIDINNDIGPSATNIPVSYSINGNTPVNEVIPGPIGSGQTLTYTFTQQANLGGTGTYNFAIWVDLPGDGNSWNDTAYVTTSVGSVSSLPMEDDFEAYNTCGTSSDCGGTNCPLGMGWTNVQNGVEDDIDWRVDNGGTPSNGTGPDVDHKPGTSTGNYVYTEASNSCNAQAAHLVSPCIDLTGNIAPVFTFWYHMEGTSMGELHVDVNVNGVWTLDVVPSLSGSQGANWLMRTVDLTAYIGNFINIRIRGITGSSWSSDIALDDFSIRETSTLPNNSAICANQSTSFFAGNAASGAAYQWYYSTNMGTTYSPVPNTPPFSGTTTATLNVTNPGAGMDGYLFYCLINNSHETDTATLNVNALPNANAGNNVTICENASTTLSATGGTTYSWNQGLGNGQTHTVSPTTTTTYTVTVTDGNSCTNTDQVTVTVAPAPNPSFSGLTSSYCENASAANLTGSPSGGTFTGSGISGSTFNPATAGTGTHTITYSYTDQNGCTGTSTTTTTVNALPNLSVSGLSASYCTSDPSVSLTGSPSGGQFSGSGVSGNSFNPASAGAGTHTITYNYTDGNGCSNSTTLTTTVNTAPVANAGTNVSICQGASTTLNASGGTGYSWNQGLGSGATHTVSPTTTTTYTVTVTDGNSCSSTDQVTVTVIPPPTVSFSGLSQSYCTNAQSVNLSGSPSGGTFSGPGVSGTTFNPATAGTGTHAVTYTFTDQNGCIGTSQVTTTVFSVPIANAGSDVTICEGSSTTLSASGGNNYSWDQGLGSGATHTVSPTTTTTYTVTVSNGNNCSSTDQITVTVLPPPSVSFSGLSQSYCEDASAVSLTGSPSGGSFSGSGVQGGQFDPAMAGAGTHVITYTFTDQNGCTGTSTSQTTVNALPTVAFTGLDTFYCNNAAATTLTGSPAGGTFSGPGVTGNSFDPVAAGNGSHSITYTFTDNNGCTNQSISSTNVDVCIGREDQALSQLILYPSPSSGTFYLQLPRDLPFHSVQVRVWDTRGKQVFQHDAGAQAGEKLQFDLSMLAKGPYHVEVRIPGYPVQFRNLILQ